MTPSVKEGCDWARSLTPPTMLHSPQRRNPVVPCLVDFLFFFAASSTSIAEAASKSSRSVRRLSKISMMVLFLCHSQLVPDQNQHTGCPVQVKVKRMDNGMSCLNHRPVGDMGGWESWLWVIGPCEAELCHLWKKGYMGEFDIQEEERLSQFRPRSSPFPFRPHTVSFHFS